MAARANQPKEDDNEKSVTDQRPKPVQTFERGPDGNPVPKKEE